MTVIFDKYIQDKKLLRLFLERNFLSSEITILISDKYWKVKSNNQPTYTVISICTFFSKLFVEKPETINFKEITLNGDFLKKILRKIPSKNVVIKFYKNYLELFPEENSSLVYKSEYLFKSIKELELNNIASLNEVIIQSEVLKNTFSISHSLNNCLNFKNTKKELIINSTSMDNQNQVIKVFKKESVKGIFLKNYEFSIDLDQHILKLISSVTCNNISLKFNSEIILFKLVQNEESIVSEYYFSTIFSEND